MSELGELFSRAGDHFGELVGAVAPDAWGNATPCTDWDVRALVNHLVYELLWVPPLLSGRTIAEVGDRFEGDQLGDDPAAAYGDALDAAKGSISAPGVFERIVHLSYGDVPGRDYLTQLMGDLVVHAWDLARGIGAGETLDPELVDVVYAAALPQADLLAASGLFDPPKPVADDADAQTRLLALFGRER